MTEVPMAGAPAAQAAAAPGVPVAADAAGTRRRWRRGPDGGAGRGVSGREAGGRQAGGRARWQVAAALPMIALFGWLLLLPLVSFVARSLRRPDGGGFTWSNYTVIFTDDGFRTSLVNSVEVAVFSTALALLVSVPTALYLAAAGTRMRMFADALLTFPLSLPGVVIGFFVIVLFGRAGLVPAASEQLTGDKHLVVAYAMPGLLLAYMYFQMPRVLATLRGAAENLDPDLAVVARTLGASRTKVVFTVVLPILRPAILSASALATVSSLGAYGTVAALSEGFRVLPLDVAEQGTVLRHEELASAMAILLAAVSLVFAMASAALERRRVR
jgi:putative spermidine/putrescine transport system permease protein